jgi:hypothetical protein
MDIVDRIRQRIEVFQPGGDTERLLQDAADEIIRLREAIGE